MTPDDKNWHSDVEPKMVLETENDITWSVSSRCSYCGPRRGWGGSCFRVN